jgi:hypothetical protein
MKQEIIDGLINEMRENREEMKKMLEPIQSFKDHLISILPGSKDFKSKHLIDEKMKNISMVLSTELAIRREINSSIQSEFSIQVKSEDSRAGEDRDIIEQIAHTLERHSNTISLTEEKTTND